MGTRVALKCFRTSRACVISRKSFAAEMATTRSSAPTAEVRATLRLLFTASQNQNLFFLSTWVTLPLRVIRPVSIVLVTFSTTYRRNNRAATRGRVKVARAKSGPAIHAYKTQRHRCDGSCATLHYGAKK